MKIYVASSWKNPYFDDIVVSLEMKGHKVYNFRVQDEAFRWPEIALDWASWDKEQQIQALDHKLSQLAFGADFKAMEWADACVLVLPCNRSGHIEAGWFAGKNKGLFIYAPVRLEKPELMYNMADHISLTLDDLLNAISLWQVVQN
jgi:hypothetical protein